MAAKKKPTAKKTDSSAGGKRGRPFTQLDKLTIGSIDSTAHDVHGKIMQLGKPTMRFPVRALSNVRYDRKVGHFQLGRTRKERTLTVNTVKVFAQSLKMMALSKEMVLMDDFATKREAYYVSKNWGDAKFDDQPESDTVMDDIEAMFSLDGVNREQLRFVPEEHGGRVAGELIVIDKDPETGQEAPVDCASTGTSAWSIPNSVEHLRFRTEAEFVLAIETGGMWNRLHQHRFWRSHKCIIVEMGGVPTRATRRFVRKLSDDKQIPVYAFVDCDPYGMSNIYRTLKVGSGNAAHLNQFFCVPKATYLGVTPQDILDFKLEDATHKLAEVDVKRAKDALKNDPFFQAYPPWQKAIEQLLKMGVRAEQQALAKWGLNFVIDEYLPVKLKKPERFLP
jgi:DNA topoisomerase-6 subunit A